MSGEITRAMRESDVGDSPPFHSYESHSDTGMLFVVYIKEEPFLGNTKRPFAGLCVISPL